MTLIERLRNSRLATALYGIMEYMHLKNTIDPEGIDRRHDYAPRNLHPPVREEHDQTNRSEGNTVDERTIEEKELKWYPAGDDALRCVMRERQERSYPTAMFYPEPDPNLKSFIGPKPVSFDPDSGFEYYNQIFENPETTSEEIEIDNKE